MDIVIKNVEFIERNLKASDVFSPETMRRAYSAIRSDFEEGVLCGWSDVDLGFDWTTDIGRLKLEKQAIEYAIYASELNLYDFIQEFIDYIEDDFDEYKDFVSKVEDGRYRLVEVKDLT